MTAIVPQQTQAAVFLLSSINQRSRYIFLLLTTKSKTHEIYCKYQQGIIYEVIIFQFHEYIALLLL